METSVISCTQKLVLYETKARFYIVGANNTETKFRVLKVDRTEPKDLVIHDDKIEYSRKEIRSLLTMIESGNRPKVNQKGSIGLVKTISAFGIVGFVRFLEGYYIILITKRRKVALIGPHTIFKVEDTSMLYIPNDSIRYVHPDENRYVKLFQSIDLSSNFYFSYSYDLTHTLQYNMVPVLNNKQVPLNIVQSSDNNKPTGYEEPAYIDPSFGKVMDSEDESISFQEFDRMESDCSCSEMDSSSVGNECHLNKSDSKQSGQTMYGVKNKPTKKYVWNDHLLKNYASAVHPDWILYITHGFIGQSNINVYGKPLYLTLIARRSNQFAGTRFLKRGINCEGSVANEIETEQIIQDASITLLHKANICSIVQLRGSIPLFWSQDISKMVPKPPIVLDQRDPYSYAAGQHFNDVLKRYGAPVIVVNLIKKKEKRKHEGILTDEFRDTIDYLNQFLPDQHSMEYIHFDMAHISKKKNSNVLAKLTKIAQNSVKKTGIYLHITNGGRKQIWTDEHFRDMQGFRTATEIRQTGVVRTNCVDCLDRTNTAQFAVGKCALGYQLYAMGVIGKPSLEFETDAVRMLEVLYEDHGDTLALQYGGSNLVHRIRDYRKLAPWSSHSRDIMQTLSRYYSNAFSDLEKQQAINLFLGIYEPCEGQLNIWEMPTDYYLHNKDGEKYKDFCNRSYSQWWEASVYASLPIPCDEESKPSNCQIICTDKEKKSENVNSFWEYYRPWEFTTLDELYPFTMTHSIRDIKPKTATDYSPFASRVGASQSPDKPSREVNPNISGKDSTSSTTSTGSEDTTSSSDSDDDSLSNDSDHGKVDDGDRYTSFKDLYPSMKQVYNVEITEPSKKDTTTYKRYVELGKACMEPDDEKIASLKLLPTDRAVEIDTISTFKLDSCYGVEPPPVSRQAKELYKAYVQIGMDGAKGSISPESTYRQYINKPVLITLEKQLYG